MPLNETIKLLFGHTIKDCKYCIVCKVSKKLVVEPDRAKLELFIHRGIIVQGKPSCCEIHLNGNLFKQKDLYRIEERENSTTMSDSEIFRLLNGIRKLT